MGDICMDTNVLADFLTQYFSSHRISEFLVTESTHIRDVFCQRINSILYSHYRCQDTGDLSLGLLVASSVAFVELARKFDSIFKGKVSISQFAAFINDPPVYFTIEPLGFDVLKQLIELPAFCMIRGDIKGIETADNLHVATALVREHCVLAATDTKLVAAYGNDSVLL